MTKVLITLLCGAVTVGAAVSVRSVAATTLAATGASRQPAKFQPSPVAPDAVTVVPATPPTAKSGLDLTGFDTSVRPQDDLYRYGAGKWLASTEIPADKSNYGSFTKLNDDAEAAIHGLVEKAAASKSATGTDAQKLGDFYASFLDTAAVAIAGIRPLQPELDRIAKLQSARDVYGYIGYNQRLGIGEPLGMAVTQDARDSEHYLVRLFQSGLTMPDRDYYLKNDPKNVEFRAQFELYVAKLLAISGQSDAQSAAKRIAALETRIANAHWTKVQNRDPVKTYNKVDLAAAHQMAPDFNWPAFLIGAGLPVGQFDVHQPSYVQELGRFINQTPIADWRVYFRFKLLDAYAPYLAQPYEDAAFDFHSRVLRGVKEQQPRWKRAIQTMDGAMGELLGKLYVEQNFTPEAKQRMLQLVGNLLKAFDHSIDDLTWMGTATKAEAKKKLAKITIKIGYPDKWRDYTALRVVSGDLLGNVQRANDFEYQRQLNQLGKPVDRSEWLLTPQTVNAYYYPPRNEIVFPAAILRPPFYDQGVDNAVNYGAIGAVIGHEMSHGFDDQGRQFDGDGNLRDWWSAEDATHFRERAARLSAQYSSYTVIDKLKLNGDLTLGENIGDLSGLAMAYKAWQVSLNGAESPTIDGYTGAQRFFFGWAQIWRRKYRDDELRMRVVADPHSPSEFRCNVIASNLDAYYEAFGLQPGDKLYRPPADRVKIW